jgi:hypothetical protein
MSAHVLIRLCKGHGRYSRPDEDGAGEQEIEVCLEH